jgi:predicted negative regulator of RcsB-dependent stress response
METEKYTVLRVRKTTRDLLKLVSVLSHESMVETIDRLARQELARIQKEQEKPDAALHKEEKAGS